MLTKKKIAGCAAIHNNLTKTEQYLEIYKRLLPRFLSKAERGKKNSTLLLTIRLQKSRHKYAKAERFVNYFCRFLKRLL